MKSCRVQTNNIWLFISNIKIISIIKIIYFVSQFILTNPFPSWKWSEFKSVQTLDFPLFCSLDSIFNVEGPEFNTRMAPGAQICFSIWRAPINQLIFISLIYFYFSKHCRWILPWSPHTWSSPQISFSKNSQSWIFLQLKETALSWKICFLFHGNDL